MASLDSLEEALRQKATASPRTRLSETQYSAGFEIFMRGSGWMTYRDFIIPQLSHLLASLSNSRATISVLEIGPGPKSILGYLSGRLRQKIRRYAAFEPNGLYAANLGNGFALFFGDGVPVAFSGKPSRHSSNAIRSAQQHREWNRYRQA